MYWGWCEEQARSLMEGQLTVRKWPQGGFEGWRSHGGVGDINTRGATDRYINSGGGAQGGDGKLQSQGDTEDLEGLGVTGGISDRGRDPEDRTAGLESVAKM